VVVVATAVAGDLHNPMDILQVVILQEVKGGVHQEEEDILVVVVVVVEDTAQVDIARAAMDDKKLLKYMLTLTAM